MHAHPTHPAGASDSAAPSSSTASAPPLVVVGAGLAGWTTVREFRKLDAQRPVIVVTADSGDFYAKPGLSNALAQQRRPEQLVSTAAAKMVASLNVTLLAHSTVEQLDTVARTLTLRIQGVDQTLAYGQLVLATGARPIRSAIAGNAADQVLSVNSLSDFATFFERLEGNAVARPGKKTVLVIGAGLIGCEFANDLLQAGHRVHVVDPSPRPLAALLPERAGLQLQEALQELGAHWHFGTTLQAVDGPDADQAAPAEPLRATLADGSELLVDAVLSAIGLRADTALATAAGLLCERGIVVDRWLRTSAEQVYALGDCAQYASAGQRTLPYVMPVMHAARALAATLAGQPTELVFPLMPVSIKTPALPIVVSAAHPSVSGAWREQADAAPGVWRFHDDAGVQRGFVLSGKSTARRQELAQATAL
jgi:rubredoxin-NAD+ reductase